MANFFVKTGILFIAVSLFLTVKSDDGCDAELENTLRTLLTPRQYPSIQLQALRNSVLRKFQEGLDRMQVKELDDKKSISSLAQWDNLPIDKRNLEALARAGYVRTLPLSIDDDDNDTDPNFKRSFANLAKNGQLPTTYNTNESKRGIESLARNGELPHNNRLQRFVDVSDKRNVGSLAKNFDFPSYGKRFVGSLVRAGDLFRYPTNKRNVGSLARDGIRTSGKRNVAALLRQDSYLNGERTGNNGYTERPDMTNEGKRNIGSIKAQFPPLIDSSKNRRNKRQVDDYYEEINEEYASPIYQNQNSYQYEDVLRALGYPVAEKRFLGRLPQMGKPKTTPSPKTRYH